MKKDNNIRAAFTLIEMMVVVALIGILIGGIFRIIGMAASNAAEADTIQRIQRVENALSGFYAEYGSYPPVMRHGSGNPFEATQDEQNDSSYQGKSEEGKLLQRALRAAGCQPMSFEFPSPQGMDEYIAVRYAGQGIYSANQNVGAFNASENDWDEVKVFKFGVMSFLLPRLQVVGSPELIEREEYNDDTPKKELFQKQQWVANNKSQVNGKGTRSFRSQDEYERVCARWMPNFEKILRGGKTLFGINTGEPDHGYPSFSSAYAQGTGNRHVLLTMTVCDGYGNSLYYYSAPPFQSYRIWSAGKDGKTFPPWISLESTELSVDQRKWVNTWIKDDIGRSP